jgi:hypothetical protein
MRLFPSSIQRLRVPIPYRAFLDVPRDLVVFLSRLLAAHRRRIGTRRRRRVLTPFAQAVLALRWFRDAPRVAALGADAGISPATAYRYLHEAITVLAEQAPDLHQVITEARQAGAEHLLLDGTLIATDRITDPAGPDRWYSGKHGHHGGNIQVLASPGGEQLWTSPVEPGSVHGLTAARTHALGALYPAAARDQPVLADKGYTGAGAGIRVPVRRPSGTQSLDASTKGWNSYVNTERAPVERAIAPLKVRWAALRRISLCPWRIGDIVTAAVVLTRMENTY